MSIETKHPGGALLNRLLKIREQQNRSWFKPGPMPGTPEHHEHLRQIARDAFTHKSVLNINAMDPLDPVHYRAQRSRHIENDYDGDMGREHADHMRDNGHGAHSGKLGSFVQIADALPVIESPSIAADIPKTAQQTLAYLAKHDEEKSDG